MLRRQEASATATARGGLQKNLANFPVRSLVSPRLGDATINNIFRG
jgi:hypothetical protein